VSVAESATLEGGDYINTTKEKFVSVCRAKGRLSIDQALQIAEELGLFDDNDAEIVSKGRKQKIREIFGNITSDGERVIRSVDLPAGRVYVDLENPENSDCIELLIGGEFRKISQSRKTINSLKKVRQYTIPGQISLETYLAPVAGDITNT